MKLDFELDPARPEACLSDLSLDRLRIGELASAEADEAQRHLAGCAECASRLEALRDDASRFSDAIWPAREAQLVQRRARRGWARPASISAISALAASVLVVLAWPSQPAMRTKGADALALFVRHSDGRVESVLPGGRLSPGDVIRFEVTSDRAGVVTVLGIDAAQAVTPYVPASALGPGLAAGRSWILDEAIELDGTLGPERIVAVVCEAERAKADLLAEARRALAAANGDPRRMELRVPGCTTSSFLIEKVPRP